MPYQTALKGQAKLGGAAFDLGTALPRHGAVALAGSNGSPLPFTDVISDVLKPTGSVLELPSDFPDLLFEKDALQMALSPSGVSLSGAAVGGWKNPFGVLNGLTLHNFQLKYSSADRTLSFAVDAEYGSLRPKGQLLFAGGRLRVAVVTLQEITLGTILAMSLGLVWGPLNARSEEHTSELQSPCNLVCRLLLEKKKNLRNNRNSCANKLHSIAA